MEGNKKPAVLQMRAGHLISFILVVVAITPLALAISSMSRSPADKDWPTVSAALIWLFLVVAYRSLADTEGIRRRRLLAAEIDRVSAAHMESLETFRHRLLDQDVVLDQIVEISHRLLVDGITDPQLALRNIRLIQSHTRDARALIEDALMQVRLETEGPAPAGDAVDLQAEVAKVVAGCSSPGITTVGARLFAHTDPAMFRVLVRNLLSGAVERGAGQIDISVTRDHGTVVCCVSDNGEQASSEPPPDLRPLADALAAALGTDIQYTRLMKRNQAAFDLPVAPAPAEPPRSSAPLDVLGNRLVATEEKSPADRPARAPMGKITFPEASHRRDRPEPVATRRKDESITR